MAEGGGFEPPEGVNLLRFSRPPQSAALPSLRKAAVVYTANSFLLSSHKIKGFLDPPSSENTLQKEVGSVTAIIGCKEGFEIAAAEEKTLEVRILNNVKAYGNLPHTVRVKLWLSEGFTADKTEFDIFAPHWTPFTLDCISEIKEIKVKAGESIRAINEIMVEIRVLDGFAREFIPLTFISK